MTFASCVNSSSLIYIIKRSVVFGLLSEFSNILLRVSLEFLSVCEFLLCVFTSFWQAISDCIKLYFCILTIIVVTSLST